MIRAFSGPRVYPSGLHTDGPRTNLPSYLNDQMSSLHIITGCPGAVDIGTYSP